MITAFTGKTGSGKTNLMVREAFKAWKMGTNIYSNTYLDFEKYKKKNKEYGKIVYFENIRDIIDAHDALVLFDEAQVLFNARLWESLPEEFQYKLQQSRKHKLDLYCTTQNLGTIDITYRRLIHQWIHCKNRFQIGSSPRILFGFFNQELKDIDSLYNNVDDLMVPTVGNKAFFIHYFSKVLYDTMYDIGFEKYKTICVRSGKRVLTFIIPKKLKLSQAVMTIKMMQTLKRL